MKFENELREYATLLVRYGLNVQPDQVVNISTEAVHADFTCMIVEEAYKAGAKYVGVELTDPRFSKIRIDNSSEDNLSFVPDYVTVKYNDLVDDRSANLKLIGSVNPEIFADSPPKKVNAVRIAARNAVQYFYDEGIGKSKVHWTVAAAPTPEWAAQIFPDLEPIKANEKLWEAIFSVCRINGDGKFLDRWHEHNNALKTRARMLNDLKIETLHFTGPDTDLKVGLHQRAVFKGGADMGPLGVDFEPNVPTEEVFTTPDYRKTEGTVATTRPFLINGKLIKGLKVTFKDGAIDSFSAESGKDTFAEYISSDEGAKRLGEVALVGIDSPIYQSGIIFREILFDENAACHIAIGSAYKFCIEGGDSLTKEDCFTIGCNESSTHTDMMISSEKVDVTATTYDGKSIKLIEKGLWVGGM